jgi:hypothetical protein
LATGALFRAAHRAAEMPACTPDIEQILPQILSRSLSPADRAIGVATSMVAPNSAIIRSDTAKLLTMKSFLVLFFKKELLLP